MRSRFIQGLTLSVIFQIILTVVVVVFLLINNHPLTGEILRSRFGAWDGNHYIEISKQGYVTEGDALNFIVFYPLYPLLIRAFTFGFLDSYIAAVLVTVVSSVLGHTFFYMTLRKLGFSFWKSFRIMLLFFVNPATVYFSHIYTEGLFLCLTSISLWFLVNKKWWQAALFGFFGSLTRLVGIIFAVPYGISALQHARKKQLFVAILAGVLILAGFGVYLLINWIVWHDPFYYQHILATHWFKSVVNPIPSYVGHFVATLHGERQQFLSYDLDIWSTLLFPIIAGLYLLFYKLGKSKRIPVAWIAWAFATWAVIAAQSFWLSNCRYILLILPLYPMLEHLTWKLKLPYIALLLAFGYLALYGINIFSKGGWLY
ncbi:MAG TPA: mannosyltransferase family protein [Patescibacteria group bacterium]|nr:mannosyltransferase family protein [Patescibacteria group bacterium]